MILKYDLNKTRLIGGRKSYYITTDDIHHIYETENIKMTDNEKITLLATLVYQLYRGFGILDTIRDMDIDGINIGTSGSILNQMNKNDENRTEATEMVRGCWLYLDGTYIHLRFMNFQTEDEIKRIITMLIRYGSKGSLTEKRGYMVCTMADKSRLLAMRPGMGETWAAWIRKFTLKNVTVQSLINKEYVKQGNIPCEFIKYLMLGQMTSIVTGRQGSGKTTLMTAMIEYVDRRYNIRVIELAPELYLRELYPDRNIYSAQQTNYISASEIQAAFKKSDAAFSLVGEISDSSLAARFVEFTMTASLFSTASHHANTTRGLVLSMRNSLIDSGAFSNMETAEAQVLECIKFNVHLDYTPDGERYVDFIEEIIPLDRREYADMTEEVPERKDYDTLEEYNAALKAYELKLEKLKLDVDRDYYNRRTDREDFAVNRILHYDLENHKYIADNKPTISMMKTMMSHMEKKDAIEFEKFLIGNWGIGAENDEMIDLGGGEDYENEGGELNVLEDDIELAGDIEGEEAVLIGNYDGDMEEEEEILLDSNVETTEDKSRNDARLVEDFIDMNDAIDAAQQRSRESSGGNSDVFGDFKTEEELEEEVMDAAHRIAALYAPRKRK